MQNAASVVVALIALAVPAQALAWGATGHRAVGEIASRHLDKTATKAIDKLLEGESLAITSTWPDEVRGDARYNCLKPFHYTTTAHGAPYPGDKAVEVGDAVQAIVAYTDILADTSKPAAERRVALRMVTHLVGDLHQPLHNGRGCDRGGNTINVTWFGQDTNLHAVWDEEVLEHEDLSYTELSDMLDVADSKADLSLGPVSWVTESHAVHDKVYGTKTGRGSDGTPCYCGDCPDNWTVFGGCQVRSCALTVGNKVQLKYGYRDQAKAVIHERLRTAGRRLAVVLNAALGKGATPAGWTADTAAIQALDGWDAAVNACELPG